MDRVGLACALPVRLLRWFGARGVVLVSGEGNTANARRIRRPAGLHVDCTHTQVVSGRHAHDKKKASIWLLVPDGYVFDVRDVRSDKLCDQCSD